MIKSSIFTRKELEVLNKRISNRKISQVDSNYLSKFIRPKLKEMASINAELMLNKIEYHQKIKPIEERIRQVILERIKDVKSIVLYGSAIQTNYKEYNDIDILVVTKNNISPIKEKIKKVIEIKKMLKEHLINSDIEIYDKETIEKTHNHSPSLIYQLKDRKIIYGSLKFKKQAEVYRMELKMKLDWSYLEDNPEGIEIYKALRNTLLVMLLLNKIVDNGRLKESLNSEIGKSLIERLKNNQESKLDRKIALIHLKSLLEKAEKEVEGKPWEKIELSNL